jgi:hypothetical protein
VGRGLVATLRADLLNHGVLISDIILPDIGRAYAMHLAGAPVLNERALAAELLSHRDITGEDNMLDVLTGDLAAAGFGVRNREIAAMRLKALMKNQ